MDKAGPSTCVGFVDWFLKGPKHVTMNFNGGGGGSEIYGIATTGWRRREEKQNSEICIYPLPSCRSMNPHLWTKASP